MNATLILKFGHAFMLPRRFVNQFNSLIKENPDAGLTRVTEKSLQTFFEENWMVGLVSCEGYLSGNLHAAAVLGLGNEPDTLVTRLHTALISRHIPSQEIHEAADKLTTFLVDCVNAGGFGVLKPQYGGSGFTGLVNYMLVEKVKNTS